MKTGRSPFVVQCLASGVLALAVVRPLDVNGDPPLPVLTLEEAEGIALEGNRALRAADLEVGRAGDRLAATKAQRWPTLSLQLLESRLVTKVEVDFPQGSLGTYPNVGPIPGRDTTLVQEPRFTTTGLLRLQQPLSQLHRIELGVRLRELDAELSREKRRGQRQATRADLRKAYYGVVQAQASVEAAREARELAGEVERTTAKRLDERAVLEADLAEARAQGARSEASLHAASNALATAREQLNLLLGRDLGTVFTVASVPEPDATNPDPGDARAEAAAGRSEVRQARLQARQAELDLKLQKSELIPDVGFVMAYASPFGIDFAPKSIFTAGLLVDWKLFDGGQRHREIAEKRKAAEQAALLARETADSASLEAGRLVRRLTESRMTLRAMGLSREAARLRLGVTRSRLEAQAALTEDLLRAAAGFADADRQYRQALAAYWSTRADYERAVGEEVP